MIQYAVYTRDIYRYKKDCVIGELYHGGGGDVAEAKIRKCDYLTMAVL